MSREFLQFLHDEQGSTDGRNRLNESVWARLDSGFQSGQFGMVPLDDILVGASRVIRL